MTASAANFNPLRAVDLLLHTHQDRAPAVLGTCFAYRQRTSWLTAAHCIGTLDAVALGVVMPFGSAGTWEVVEERHAHPMADIAVLRLAESDDSFQPFWNHVSNYGFGEDFAAFGFPESIFAAEQSQPTPRLFKGHYQRVMYYVSHLGFRYNAAELSIPAPAGLSGGPVFRPTAPRVLTGMVTENLESTTYLEEVEEVQAGDRVRETRYQRVVAYGVGLLLDGVEEWLDEHAPLP